MQIAKIGDFCNECGNCDTFCPTSGAPYKVKPTFWLDEEGFREAKGDAYRLERHGGRVVLTARRGRRSSTAWSGATAWPSTAPTR